MIRRSRLFLSLAALLCTAGAPASKSSPPAETAPQVKSSPPARAVPPAKAAPKGAPRAKSVPAPVSPGLEFPANEAGRHASTWFEAFNQGEAAMKKYIQTHVALRALKRRSVEGRIKVYREMRDKRGKVTALEVEEFTESRVKVTARGERAGRFSITFLCDEEPPHGLVNVRVEDLPPEEGTPEGIDDGGYSEAPAGPPMSEARVKRPGVLRCTTSLVRSA